MDKYYFFADTEKRNLFMGTPVWFIDDTVFWAETLPHQLKAHEAATLVFSFKERQLNGYCPVSLIQGKPIEESKGFDLQ